MTAASDAEDYTQYTPRKSNVRISSWITLWKLESYVLDNAPGASFSVVFGFGGLPSCSFALARLVTGGERVNAKHGNTQHNGTYSGTKFGSDALACLALG